MKLEQKLDDNIGLNNKRVWPKSDSKQQRGMMYQQFDLQEPSHTEKIMELSKNVKQVMAEEKFAVLTRDPENVAGHQILRDKYSLP